MYAQSSVCLCVRSVRFQTAGFDRFDCLHMFTPFDIQRPIHQDNPATIGMLTVRAIDFDFDGSFAFALFFL